MISLTYNLLSLFFCCHLTLYGAIAAYKIVSKSSPIKNNKRKVLQKESNEYLRVHQIMCIVHTLGHILLYFYHHITYYAAKPFPNKNKKHVDTINFVSFLHKVIRFNSKIKFIYSLSLNACLVEYTRFIKNKSIKLILMSIKI